MSQVCLEMWEASIISFLDLLLATNLLEDLEHVWYVGQACLEMREASIISFLNLLFATIVLEHVWYFGQLCL